MYTIIHYLFSHFIQVLSFYHKHSDLTTNFDIYIYQSSIFPSSTFISKYPKSSRQPLQFITPSTLLLFRLQTRATQRYFPPFQKISLQNIKLHYIFQTIFHQDNFYAIHHFLAPSPNTSLTLHKNLSSSPQKSFEKLLPRSKIIRHLDKPIDSPPFSRFIPRLTPFPPFGAFDRSMSHPGREIPRAPAPGRPRNPCHDLDGHLSSRNTGPDETRSRDRLRNGGLLGGFWSIDSEILHGLSDRRVSPTIVVPFSRDRDWIVISLDRKKEELKCEDDAM